MNERLQRLLASRRLRIGAAIVGAFGLIAASGWAVIDRSVSTIPVGPEGPRLSIAVVDPREPDIQPGEVMDVGTLTDSFDRASLRSAPSRSYLTGSAVEDYVDVAYSDEKPVRRMRSDRGGRNDDIDVGYGGDERLGSRDEAEFPRRPYVRPVRSDGRPGYDPRSSDDRYKDNPRHFGFDAPRPDYAGERAARREAREARIAQEREFQRREYQRRASGYGPSNGGYPPVYGRPY